MQDTLRDRMLSNIWYMSSESEWCYCSQWTISVGVGKYCAFLRDGLGVLLLFYWTNRRWQNHSALLQMGGITRARWSHVAHAHIGSLVSGFVIVVILRSPEFILGRSIILLSLLTHSPVSLASSSKTPEHRCAEASRSTYSSSSLRHTICPAPGMWPSGSHLAPVAA